MVLGFVTRKFRPLGTSTEKTRRTATAGALLVSLVADANIVANWTYCFVVSTGDDDDDDDYRLVPSWMTLFQLAACVLGSISWLVIVSDGWLLETVTRGVLSRRVDKTNRARSSNSANLLLGLVMEDAPQLIITLLIENFVRNNNNNVHVPNRRGTSWTVVALLNLTLASVDALHKAAEAYDTRSEMVDAGDAFASSRRRTMSGHDGYVASISSATGAPHRVLTASYDHTARLWDVSRGRSLRVYAHHTNCVNAVRSLDRDRLVTVSDDKTAKVVNVTSGECLKTLHHYFSVGCVAVAPSGRLFVTGGGNGKVHAWDSDTYGVVSTHRTDAVSLDFVDEERFVACSRDSAEPRLWRVAKDSDEPRLVYKGHGDAALVVATLVRGSSFLTGSRDGVVKLWSADHGRCVKTFAGHASAVRGATRVNDVRFVSASHDRTARLWDATNASCLAVYDEHQGDVRDAVFLPEQGAVATVSHDKTVRVWSIKSYLLDDDDHHHHKNGTHDAPEHTLLDTIVEP